MYFPILYRVVVSKGRTDTNSYAHYLVSIGDTGFTVQRAVIESE